MVLAIVVVAGESRLFLVGASSCGRRLLLVGRAW